METVTLAEKYQNASGTADSWQVHCCMLVLAGQRHISCKRGVIQNVSMRHTTPGTVWQHSSAAAKAVSVGLLVICGLCQHCTPCPSTDIIRLVVSSFTHCCHA
jgi:hypothetical protein